MLLLSISSDCQLGRERENESQSLGIGASVKFEKHIQDHNLILDLEIYIYFKCKQLKKVDLDKILPDITVILK